MPFKNRNYRIQRYILLLALLGLILAALQVTSARAGTLFVTNTSDSGPGSLRQAIADAMPGDTITFAPWLFGGLIHLNSQLLVNKDLTIDGSALYDPLTLSGGLTTRIMQVESPARVTVSGLTFTEGFTNNGDGGAVHSTGEFIATDSIFIKNSASGDGGAISGIEITLTNSTLSANVAGGSGGAIHGVQLTIKNTTINGNQANYLGGAIEFSGSNFSTIVNSTITENLSGNRGGAISNGGVTYIDIINSTFAKNTATTGHEFYLAGVSNVTLVNTIFVCTEGSDDCYVQSGNTIVNPINSILGVGSLLDYGLTALADNGGRTETMAPLHDSPLIDAGDDVTCASEPVNGLDQRGAPRPQGSHCDIGSYEYGSSPPTSTTTPSPYPFTPSTSTPTFTPYSPPTSTLTGTPTSTPTRTPTNTSTSTPTITPTLTPSRTPTVPGTPTTGTPISNCEAVHHGTLTLYGNSMSLSITNQTGVPLAIQEVFVVWDHDRGHQQGNDKSLRLQQASLNGTPFWTGDHQGPSITIVPSNVFIPSGDSTIRFTFHQTYDRSDGSEELFISLGTNGCQNDPIHSREAVILTPIGVWIGGLQAGYHGVGNGQATRVSYPRTNNGPVKSMSVNMRSIVGSEALIYKVNGVNTSFSEMMALPASQLDTTYWLPWYNNVELDTQLRFANVSNSMATVHIYINGVQMPGSPFTLASGASTRKSFPGVNNGPVRMVSNQAIVAAERVIYKVNGVNTSFSEMMALPANQLDTTYWLPWYNNVDLDTQLRFANTTNTPATIHVFIGGQEMQGSPFALAPGASTRKSFAGINNGPVKIVSDQIIVTAERVIYKVNGINTSFSEMMALPSNQLNTTYWLPWYNNVDLDTQLRFANVSGSTATVRVYIGEVEMVGSPFTLAPGASTRKSFPGLNSGPVKIVSDQTIVATERVIYKVNGIPTSFSEMMGLPNNQLNTTHWLPWYNNVDLITQLRFGVP